MLTKISPMEAHKKFTEGTARLIDIRSVVEFAQMSIEGSTLAPLPVVALQNLEDKADPQKDVVFFCRSGKRTENAAHKLSKLFPNAYILDGGILEWQKANLPLRIDENAVIPLERQILIAAGVLVLLGFLGSFIWEPLLFLAGFVGAGLVFAGVSGFCGLGILLSKMPWNKA